jgi:hypothetical protein
MSDQHGTGERAGPPGPRETRWTWLLLIPLAGTLIPPIYNTHDPELFGIPFFYWYQMAWVVISTALTMTAYQLWQRDQRARKAARSEASQNGGASA